MSTSPALVVETLNRYLFLDSPNVRFLDSIDLSPAAHDQLPTAFVLTFTFQHVTHSVSLQLVQTLQDNGTHWHIIDVEASHPDLPVEELRVCIARSHTLHHPLFRSLECAIAVLRTRLHHDPSNRTRHSPHTAPHPHMSIQRTLPPPSQPAHYPALLCVDLQLSLLYAALTSARSTVLVDPVPACFVDGAGAVGGVGVGGEEAAGMMERNDRVDVGRVEGKVISAQLPAIEAAFAGLPGLTTIDFASTPANQSQDSLSSSHPKQPLHSLPLPAQHLLACLLASHTRFRSVRPQPNLYTIGHTAAHKHAAATAGSASLTLPDYQFDLVPLPHPHLRSQAALHTSRPVFHGSPLPNWHSIVRRGLESKSGTREQTSGALFGQGIYFSDDLRVARMFSSAGSGVWPGSVLGDRLEVVGLYELVMDAAGVRMGEEVVRGKVGADGGKGGGVGGRQHGEEEEVPENYFVASNNSYFELKSLLVWRVMNKKNASVLRSSWMMIVGYVVLLLVIVMSQLDWKYVRNVSWRFIQQYR